MRHSLLRRRCASTTLLLTLAAVAPTALAQAPEFRAMWVSRFEWPSANPATCQARITQIMDDLADANFNAVVFQVRGQADVLYPSPEEVWSPLIGGADPGWDPLAFAISAAHARGLEFHAYINTHTCWQSNPASARTLPPNPAHVFYLHCDATDPARRDWLHHDSTTNPVQFSESEYVWFAPGVPAVQAYTRRQVLHVVANYDVDGVHYDRIRTPWSNQPSFDPISLARFADPQTNPAGLDFAQWTADQITRQVRDTYAAIMAVKPHVKVSAAVYSDPNSAPTAQHQAAAAWAQAGALDILIPMMYFSGGAGSTWDTRLGLWLSRSGGRHVVAGHITSQGVASLLDQIALTRTRGAQGNNVFSWSSFTGWSDYLSGPYAAPASVPPMSWKSSPTTAVIYGYVTDADGEPVVDAQVTRSGSSYVGLSSGDGFYSFLLVPPGVYALTAFHPGYETAAISGLSVAAGQVRRQDVALGPRLAPVLTEVVPNPDSAPAGSAYVRQLALSQGRADSWQVLTGPPGASVDASGRVFGWTPTLAQIGQTVAFVVRATNPAGMDEVGWSVLVTPAPDCEPFALAPFDAAAVGTRVLFQLPRFSGSTSGDLTTTPNVGDVVSLPGTWSPPNAFRAQWQFVDAAPHRWMRLTTSNAPVLPNPTIPLDRPIRVRLRLDSGRLRVCIGIRETNASAEIGADGGTSGTIEWVGAASDVDDAPQGRLVEPQPGVWQTLVFDPLRDPITGFTGNGVLTTASGLGVFEHIGFTAVDSVGPFTVYIDDIDVLCPRPPFGDADGDGQVTAADLPLLADCMSGPDASLGAACEESDADGDEDGDLHDWAAIQLIVAGN